MKVSPVVVLLNLFLIGSVCEAAQPVKATTKTSMHLAVPLKGIECDACQFIAKELDEKVFHNDHLVELAQAELDNICNVLPTDAKDICYAAVNNTVPDLLGKIGDYVADEGCTELGICTSKK